MMISGWWTFSRQAIEALTNAVDSEATDRAVEDLARESQIGRALHHASWITRRAWGGSRARAAVSTVAAALTATSSADTLRQGGWTVVVAGASVLVLNSIKSSPPGPLSSLVPALMVGAGALLMLMAAPLNRAWADRRSRHKGS